MHYWYEKIDGGAPQRRTQATIGQTDSACYVALKVRPTASWSATQPAVLFVKMAQERMTILTFGLNLFGRNNYYVGASKITQKSDRKT